MDSAIEDWEELESVDSSLIQHQLSQSSTGTTSNTINKTVVEYNNEANDFVKGNTSSLSTPPLAPLPSPSEFLGDSALRAAHPYFEYQIPQFRILANSNPANRQYSRGVNNASTNSGSKSIEQREEEYEEARRRILGENTPINRGNELGNNVPQSLSLSHGNAVVSNSLASASTLTTLSHEFGTNQTRMETGSGGCEVGKRGNDRTGARGGNNSRDNST